MSRDTTLFQFDVDEAAVRRLLSLIPGVTPLPADDAADAADDRASSDVAEADVTPPPDEARPGEDDAARDAQTATDGHPSTPWPGAPVDEETPDEGLVGGFSTKQVLLAVGLVLGLGVIGVGVVWFLKQRGDDAPAGGEYESTTPGGRVADRDDEEARTDDGGPAADEEARSYPIDPAPIVGMGFLAVGTLVLRHVRTDDGE